MKKMTALGNLANKILMHSLGLAIGLFLRYSKKDIDYEKEALEEAKEKLWNELNWW